MGLALKMNRNDDNLVTKDATVRPDAALGTQKIEKQAATTCKVWETLCKLKR